MTMLLAETDWISEVLKMSAAILVAGFTIAMNTRFTHLMEVRKAYAELLGTKGKFLSTAQDFENCVTREAIRFELSKANPQILYKPETEKFDALLSEMESLNQLADACYLKIRMLDRSKHRLKMAARYLWLMSEVLRHAYVRSSVEAQKNEMMRQVPQIVSSLELHLSDTQSRLMGIDDD